MDHKVARTFVAAPSRSLALPGLAPDPMTQKQQEKKGGARAARPSNPETCCQLLPAAVAPG